MTKRGKFSRKTLSVPMHTTHDHERGTYSFSLHTTQRQANTFGQTKHGNLKGRTQLLQESGWEKPEGR